MMRKLLAHLQDEDSIKFLAQFYITCAQMLQAGDDAFFCRMIFPYPEISNEKIVAMIRGVMATFS